MNRSREQSPNGTDLAAIAALEQRVVELEQMLEQQRSVNATLQRRLTTRTDELQHTSEALETTIAKQREISEAYQTLIQQSLQALIIFQDGRTVFANPAASRITGYSHDELLAMSAEEARATIHPEDCIQVVERGRERLAGKPVPTRYEFRIIRKDGSTRWVEADSTLIHYRGKPAAQMAYIDITRCKEIEEALRQSEEKFRCFFEQSQDGMVLVNKQGTIIEWSQGAENIFGLPRAQVVGNPTWDVLFSLMPHEQRTPEAYEHLKTSTFQRITAPEGFPHHSTAQMRRRVQRPDGTHHLISASEFPIQTRHELLMGGIIRDITELQQTEERLRQSQLLLERTFAALRDAVFTIDENAHIITCNPAATDMFGYPYEELFGQSLALLLTDRESWHSFTRTLFRAVQDPGYLFLPEYAMKRKDGTIFWTEHSMMPLCDDQGRYVGWVGVVRDISDHKHTKAQLQQANDELRQRVDELKQHNREIMLLNEMATMLQGCISVDDAYQVIARTASHIFIGQSGTLSIQNPISQQVEVVTKWGNPPLKQTTFDPKLCRTVQQHKTCVVRTTTGDPPCCHLDTTTGGESSMCIPIIDQEEVLGVLSLCDGPVSDYPTYARWKRLAEMIAGHFALSLTNLRMRHQLQEQAIRDPLTGLFNRRYLDETLRREMQRASRFQHVISIIMMDIDHFKHFNDTYGHDMGDAVLRAVGNLLQASIRAEDIACRYGGEEFTLVLPGASLEDTRQRAEKLRTEIAAIIVEHQGQPLEHITMSLGVASFPRHGTSDDAVMKAADTALYHAKTQGRNRVVVAEG